MLLLKDVIQIYSDLGPILGKKTSMKSVQRGLPWKLCDGCNFCWVFQYSDWKTHLTILSTWNHCLALFVVDGEESDDI